jgi:hypothetical protein
MACYHPGLVAIHPTAGAARRPVCLALVLTSLALVAVAQLRLRAQAQVPHDELAPVALQPLAQQVRRVESVLAALGQPLSTAQHDALNRAIGEADERRAIAQIEEALAGRVLLDVTINPESRVSVVQGTAAPALVEGGSQLFLVRVRNQAGVTAPLRLTSPNGGPVHSGRWKQDHEPAMTLTARDSADRWADFTIFQKPPMSERLSGLGLEYAVLEIYSRDRGQRAAEIRVDVGQGSGDIGSRNGVSIVFTAAPGYDVTFRVRDETDRPAIAAFTVRDRAGRIYPLGAKRLAPDLPFQPHVYRGDGENITLPAGTYDVSYSSGPEYQPGRAVLDVTGTRDAVIDVRLRRWIDPAAYGYYSGDHHVHAAGCSHYQNPTQGVGPEDMMRQVRGEALNVGAVLTWGPCYYHQKQFFSGTDHPLSSVDRLLHYDVEVSGFPSSHAGHLVLLGLTDQDYPGATRIEGWPSWDLPILQWAARQKAVVGFAHSGWGLESKSRDLPNYEMPAFDGIGANEYIIDVTHPGAVDFISAADTPYPWELNIWYHTLNVGFRTRISGETDFPCITDERVGAGRTYAKLDRLTYRGWLDAVRDGRSYVSDGVTHLMDFAVNGVAVGSGSGEVAMPRGATAHVTVQAAALLNAVPDVPLRDRAPDEKPYWAIERARIGDSREVPVELVVNGTVVARRTVLADGVRRPVTFDVPLAASAWIAVRVLGAAHTNPIFAIVDGKPIRASRRSAEWCLAAVDQCWTQKVVNIRAAERDAAAQAYEHARGVYRRLIDESVNP